ncbi:hypothetical protein OR16_37830, partial [Cupriavidus basilensis OR16]
PLASPLRALQSDADASHACEDDRVAAIASYTPVFGDLGSSHAFVQAVAAHTRMLRERGVLATVEAVAGMAIDA